MITDSELHRNVLDELEFEPRVDSRDIGIAVNAGIVTMTGKVRSFTEKWAAEDALKRVDGVRGLANELIVELAGTHQVDDTDLAQTASNLLRWTPGCEDIQVAVSHGVITLNGEVDWQYQKYEAERLIRPLRGVISVNNVIELRHRVAPADVKRRIEGEFQRTASLDAKDIDVTTHDGGVKLTGTVHSWAERQNAERAAWSIPGVMRVENELAIA